MTADLLLLIPQSFPYGDRADFLADEIDHLAGAFRAIRLAPTAPRGLRQPIPSNVTVDLDLARLIGSRPRRITAGLVTSEGRRLLMGELAAQPVPRRHPDALGRLAAAAGIAAETARWAASLGPLPPASLALTVWFGAPTVGLAAAGLRVVSRAHGGDLFAQRGAHGYLPLQRRQLLACERVFSVSDVGRDDLRHRFPDLADRCETRRLGINPAPRTAPASTDGTLRLVSCSSLTPVKRPLLLVAVVAELARHGVPAEWHHFGSGPLLRPFQEAVAALPASVQVTVHGHVPNRQVLTHYGTNPVDVFVNVSWSEGVPVSIMEAMSAGIPVVATDAGGTREIVDDTTGALVAVDAAPSAIATAVQRVARASDCRRSLIRRQWAQRYNAQRNYAAFAAELEGLARRADRSALHRSHP